MSAKKKDAVEAVFTIASVWLALRGEDSESIGARALAAARVAEDTRKRLEAFVMNNVRQHVGCQQPAACSCLVCAAYEAEHRLKAKTSKSEQRPS